MASFGEITQPENAERNGYELYRGAGGIIDDENDYNSALEHAKNMKMINKHMIEQAGLISQISDIVLSPLQEALYSVLREDTNLAKKYHYNQKGDQFLFAEVLRMLGDTESLKKVMDAHPNIFRNG
ncbi:MAG: hypothetical protein UX74_C0005G0025 [Parcubacteria group bacterium GW2011_GWA2_47_10b]|uniref:Uncharacterized protein n=1 Tax=Candidatus Ryanbacteria bacterium RIFCSPLOWO2_02_FULL_47_14 TaxID=1802129 RepID=A0A1G2H2A7_9BACT|nr:MAG: hypothetical protein UX74_C0005G0025 [Parcubacteria group bacterium GW2011_GWA2_47_10b]OGZ49326.1 MAG: hypothetical protein A3C83_01905 [Candidatus Ryanbacteria bacterium RIFCSPHIGHO2_02_FULL_47_25]OGZ56605.1 MAG: hypothetical protein A3J04_02020 [Candidatus Ryanbacteria bacterium RIFCSPLOWO2_02_FULL_47_14]